MSFLDLVGERERQMGPWSVARETVPQEERLAVWWGHLSQNERGGLSALAGQPISCAYETEFELLDVHERIAILNAVRSFSVFADLVLYGSHEPLGGGCIDS